MMSSVEKMIDQYILAWNQTGLESYSLEFEKCWGSNALYSDQYSEHTGVQGIADFADQSLKFAPDRKFSVLEIPECHHTYGRYAWKVETGGKTNVGYDYFEFNAEFKITKLISFFTLPDDYPIEKLG
ncbi:isomerase [Pedobacter duraquae]|nr:isomerase [Pedobacter duraquae]